MQVKISSNTKLVWFTKDKNSSFLQTLVNYSCTKFLKNWAQELMLRSKQLHKAEKAWKGQTHQLATNIHKLQLYKVL